MLLFRENAARELDELQNSEQLLKRLQKEEAAAYFNGQKQAKDVADVIQSRVQIYVSENS